MSYSGIGDAIDVLGKLLIGLIVFALPLAIWKLVDISIWLYRNTSISFGG